jgi:hypothetical protein
MSDKGFLGWPASIVVRLSGPRARGRQTSAVALNEGSDCSGVILGGREALAHNRRNSARSALYLAPGRLHSEPYMIARPSRVQTDHFHLPRPRRFSSMSNDAKLYPRSGMSRREPVCEAAMEFVEQSLLALDSAFVQFALLLCLRAREQQAIVSDNFLAAADQQV